MANLNARFIKIGENTYNVGWSKNNLSDELLEKLNGIATGAQVNVIETIKMNGSAVAVTQKTVDLGNLQKKLNAGAGIALTEDGTISTTLDTDVFVVKESQPSAPDAGKENKIYLWPVSGETGNQYSENIWVDGKWEKVGTFKADMDLSSYAKKSEVEAVDTKVTQLTSRVSDNETAIGSSSDSASETGSIYARVAANKAAAKTAKEAAEAAQQKANANESNISTANGKISTLETAVGKNTDTASATGSAFARIAAVKKIADDNQTEIAAVRTIAEGNNKVTFDYTADTETLNITVA